MVRAYLQTGVRSYREAMVQALGATGRIEIVGTAAHPADALSEVPQLTPEVALLDLPGPAGPAWARQVAAAAPLCRLIALAVDEAEVEVIAWAEAGVAGYVGREASLSDVVAAIEAVAAGEAACPSRMAAILLRRIASGFSGDPVGPLLERHLTARECEIVRLIGEGLSNQQIARKLYIALPTVKNHVHNILEKLEVRTRTEAVREFRRAGIILRRERPAPSLPGAGSPQPEEGR